MMMLSCANEVGQSVSILISFTPLTMLRYAIPHGIQKLQTGSTPNFGPAKMVTSPLILQSTNFPQFLLFLHLGLDM